MAQRLVVGTLVLLLLASTSAAVGRKIDEERRDYIREHYSKFEYRIPMRDGKKLFTAVFVPNEAAAEGTSYPILLFRTPYSVGPYGADRYRDRLGPHRGFEEERFIFALQDVRGRFMSDGEFVNMRPHIERKRGPQDVDESTDTYDTVEWLLRNVDHHNGKVGQWGVSYPGFYSAAGMIDTHPALVAVSPQAPISDWFWDDMHHHGAFILPLAFRFFSTFGRAREGLVTEWPKSFDFGTPDGYQFYLDMGPLKNANELHFNGEIEFWNRIVEHPNYDEFWQQRNLLPHLRNVRAAVMIVGGWFDTEDLYGPLKIYQEIEKHCPGIFNVLVMGPWRHGGWERDDGDRLGEAEFGSKTSRYYREHVDLPFFEHFLKGEADLALPEALVFETGANRWRRFEAWPPPDLKQRDLFARSEGRLGFERPSEGQEAHDSYVSDPRKPVPYTMEITTRWAKDYVTEDQRFAARRPDVLVYRGEPLEEDLTLAGPAQAELWVSTSGTDSDWVVKIIDVFPHRRENEEEEAQDEDEVRDEDERDEGIYELGGTQRLVRAEVFRGRFRDSYEYPKPFVPGEVTRVSFELQDFFHTFERGHRVMMQIQSTWFPFVDRNPQRYVPNIFEAEEDDFIPVTNRVYRSKEHPTHIRVGVLE